MKDLSPTDDLSVLVRRDEATPSQRRRLEMLLKASPAEQLLHRLGRDYDEMETDEPGDEQLIARAVARAAGAPRLAPRWGRRHVAIAGVAVGSLVTLAAAAVTIPRFVPTPDESGPTDGVVASAAEPPRALVAQPRSTELPREVASPSPSPSPSAPTTSSPFVSAVPTLSAAEQFSHANTLRKSSQMNAAIAAYWQLQRQHPKSSEALLSHVLLGRLLLRQGSASAANAQFSRYLAASPGGSLAEEALHGKATALRMSGRTAEERQVHRELVQRFPDSVYARTSRARLEALK